MRIRLPLVVVSFVALIAAVAIHAQITNPIPARVSFVRDLPDGRRFANDSRGLLYLLERLP